MRPGRALFAALFASCFSAGAALSLSSDAPRRLRGQDSIPKYIWVTGQWRSDSAEVKDQMATNIGYLPLKRREIERVEIESYYAKWAPIGSSIRYLTDEDMDDSVRNISTMLAGIGITDVDKAYFNLRPGAFRADVWRLMQLWADGGVYLDVNINLTRPLTDWIDFSRDELVIVTDTGVPNGIWNAMMAAEQRNQYIERAIADITGNILRHYYGNNPLAITGPIALGKSVRVRPGYPRGLRRDLEWRGNVGEVTSVRAPGKDEAVVARKDETLHDRDPSKHYDPMWRHKQVYCDQRGPRPDNGKCPVDS